MIGFFTDSGLSTPAARMSALQASDGTAPPVDLVAYFGDLDASRVWKAASDPGVDDIVVTVFDSEGGESLLPSVIRLATTQVGLDTATPGAELNIGPSVDGGSANAITIWLRFDTNVFDAGLYDNLSLAVNALVAEVV
jgi:hypothetical protein